MILAEIPAPEHLGKDTIQIVSTKHVEEYVAMPEFQARHIDAAMLLDKAKEAAVTAYARFAQDRVRFHGVAKSESTGIAIVFGIEATRQWGVVTFTLVTAMMKSTFAPKYENDVLIKISKKRMTFSGHPCVEIGRNVYASTDSFLEGVNAEGILQELVVADIDRNRKVFLPDVAGHFGADDGYVNYVADVDIHGNIYINRAWWRDIEYFMNTRIS